MNISDKQLEYLYARLSDMADESERGVFRAGAFFSLAEQVKVRAWLSRRGGTRYLLWGGYENAERARVYFLPDYMSVDSPAQLSSVISDYGYDDPTVLLRIDASGFRELSHRDFMGALLSLGIERDVIGDIVTEDKYTAYVFCDRAIAEYITDNLKKVANDAVRVSPASLPKGDFGAREYKVIKDTVASGRFDAVIAAVCGVSRDVSKKLVCGGMCELNFEEESSPDTELEAGDIFSVRGYGRYKLVSYDGENRRGRCRITVYKYV